MNLKKIIFIFGFLFIVSSINAEHYFSGINSHHLNNGTEALNADQKGKSQLVAFDGLLQLSLRLTENGNDCFPHLEHITTGTPSTSGRFTCFSLPWYKNYLNKLKNLKRFPLYIHHRRLRIWFPVFFKVWVLIDLNTQMRIYIMKKNEVNHLKKNIYGKFKK